MPLVKVISKTGALQRQMPASGCWGGCEFTFARGERGYDWLVVYDDIPPANRLGKVSCEALACSPDNAILVTHEPAAVKIHGTDFCGQFSHVLTCHEPWALRHAGRVDMQPLSPWWYGMHLPGARQMTYDMLATMAPWERTRDLVVTCSDKQQTHTLHSKRFAFTRALAARLPQMAWFGHGVRGFGDKSEVLHDYKYHIVVENPVRV